MGSTTAALWDVLAKAANLAQMSGLHAVMLVAAGATFLHIPQSMRECAELERCARRLRGILQWPTTDRGVWPDMGGPVNTALGDAAGNVDSYKKSTLWRRVRRGRSMARQLRDMQDVVNSYCTLVLFINAHLLVVQATTHPTSDATTYVRYIQEYRNNSRIHEVNDPPEAPGVQAWTKCPTDTASRDTQWANVIAQGGVGSQTGNTDQPECERRVPDIVISHA